MHDLAGLGRSMGQIEWSGQFETAGIDACIGCWAVVAQQTEHRRVEAARIVQIPYVSQQLEGSAADDLDVDSGQMRLERVERRDEELVVTWGDATLTSSGSG